MAINFSYIENGNQKLAVIDAENYNSKKLEFLSELLECENKEIKKCLLTHGAILIRGFEISSNQDFIKVKKKITNSESLDYFDGNSPRTKINTDVYTSTEYPNELSITLHNELSYSNKWPTNIFFYCETPSEVGGETPIIDGRYFLKLLDNSIVNEFEKKGIIYSRFLNDGNGFGKSWKNTFDTTNRKVVEEYCIENNIKYSWIDNSLYVEQFGPGIIKHETSQERVWFNQANQFHPSSLPIDVFNLFTEIYGSEKYKFPHYSKFGTGEEIPTNYLKEITEISFKNSIVFKWQKGDLLILDNMLMAHGRLSYSGYRKIYVSMS